MFIFIQRSHKQRARLAPLVNVPARYDGTANEIFSCRWREVGTKKGGGAGGVGVVEEKKDKIICDKNLNVQSLHSVTVLITLGRCTISSPEFKNVPLLDGRRRKIYRTSQYTGKKQVIFEGRGSDTKPKCNTEPIKYLFQLQNA